MNNQQKLAKYHTNYVPVRRFTRSVAVSARSIEIEKRALQREAMGHYRIAAKLWLDCFDAAEEDNERAKIAVRRDQCIAKGNRLRRGEYSGVGCLGVVYE